jgi:ribosomal protein S11
MNNKKKNLSKPKLEEVKLPQELPIGKIPTLSELLLPKPLSKKLKIPLKTVLKNKKRKFAKRKVRELKSFRRNLLRKRIPLNNLSNLATKLYDISGLENDFAEREIYINNRAAERIRKALSLAAIIKRVNIRKKISPIRTKLASIRPSKVKSYQTVKLVNQRQIRSVPLTIKTTPLTKYKFKRFLNFKKELFSYLRLRKKKRRRVKVKRIKPKKTVLPKKLYLAYKTFLERKRKLQELQTDASKLRSRKKRRQYFKALFNEYRRIKIRLRNKYIKFMLHDKWVEQTPIPPSINITKTKKTLTPIIKKKVAKLKFKSRTVYFGAKAYLNEIQTKPKTKEKQDPFEKKAAYLNTKLNQQKRTITEKTTKFGKLNPYNRKFQKVLKKKRRPKPIIKRRPKPIIKRKRKRLKRFLLKVRQSKNNLFVTITNIKSNPYVTLSAGRTAMTGPRRASPFAAELLGRMVGSKLAIYFRLHVGYIIFKTHLTKHLRSFFRAISGKFKRFIGILDFIPRPHGLGLRGRKIRRL